MRTDFIDYPTGWEIQREVGTKLEHDPRCSSVPQTDMPMAGPAFLCDCAALPVEWARRAIELEPERESEIRAALQRYLPAHMQDDHAPSDPSPSDAQSLDQSRPIGPDDPLSPSPLSEG